MNSKRYERQIALPEIGIEGQQKLSKASVLVVGAGGLGCPVLQNLVAAGLGCLGIVDGDVVEESNLHRQYLYTIEECGKQKAEVAANILLKQNPQLNVIFHNTFFSRANAAQLVSDFEIIVDCTDNLPTRYLINDIAVAKGIPMVYASIHKFEGQLSVFNFNNGPTYRCLFPDHANPDHLPDCIQGGVLGVLPNTIGVLQATEVLKIILGIGESLSGKLLVYDGLNHSVQTIGFSRRDLEVAIGLENGRSILNGRSVEAAAIDNILFFDALENGSHHIINLIEEYQEASFEHPSIKQIPLTDLEKYLEVLDKDQPIIFCCEHGQTSFLAADYSLKKGFTHISHLQHGLCSLVKSNHNND